MGRAIPKVILRATADECKKSLLFIHIFVNNLSKNYFKY